MKVRFTSTGTMSGIGGRREPAYTVSDGFRNLGMVARKGGKWFARGTSGPTSGPHPTRAAAADALAK